MEIEILQADYETHGSDLGYLLDCYARDPMGGSAPLADNIKNKLAAALAQLPHAFSVICYVNDKPAGLINCFDAFSTFKCKPLVNIHDIYVADEFRGLGLSHKMLAKVVKIAEAKGCCKLTLEVLEGNKVARGSYEKFGFSGYQLDSELGQASFWQMTIND